MKLKAKAVTAAAAGIAVGTAAIKKSKDPGFCPFCAAKKAINRLRLTQGAEKGYNNAVAMTPPMGWSSWNLFRNKISEELIKEIADAMKNSGLADAGYTYVNIDDCWQGSERDASGKLQWDKYTFPSGIRALSEYVNSRGLKLGIYSSNGTLTCEDYPASLRNERIDAETLAEWGIEYFKYDFCHNVPIPSEAPKLLGVSLIDEGGTPLACFKAEDVRLSGKARIVNDASVRELTYIDGLSSGQGSFSIDVNSEKEKMYTLNLDIRKSGLSDKFVRVLVNGKDEYHIYVPGTKGFTPEGKAQTEVLLQKGENHIEFSNPVGSRMDSSAIQYKLMGRELKRATRLYSEKNGVPEKPIVFSICEWGINRPWKWGREAGNLWRTTMDIKPLWLSVMSIYEHNVRLYKYASPGAWNDPDMLEVGNGSLTYEENKSHFSLWCMMAAPLILGNDIRKFVKADGTPSTEDKIYKILTNRQMIALNQDSLGIQCRRIKAGIIDILVKPLADSSVAICILNKSGNEKSNELILKNIANLGFVNLESKNSYQVYDVWEEKYIENADKLVSQLPSHGVKVYIIK